MEKKTKCSFCNSTSGERLRYEKLHLSRWYKEANTSARKQKVCISIPSCEKCFNLLHPFINDSSHMSRYIAIISSIAPLCILFSIIQKDTFLVNPLAGVLILIISAGISYAIIFFLYEIALHIYEDVFSASLSAKPYCDLPIVKVLIAEGFEDGEGSYRPSKDIIDMSHKPLSNLESELKDNYSCLLKREK